MEDKKDHLQKYLYLIRTSAGWSTTDLGNKLGVTRQMISNLETGRNKMTRIQYLAIRQVFDEEIKNSAENNDTQMLKDLLRVLVDEYDNFSEEERNQVLSDANLLAPSIVTKKTTRKNATIKWVTVLAGVIVAAGVAAAKVILNSDD